MTRLGTSTTTRINESKGANSPAEAALINLKKVYTIALFPTTDSKHNVDERTHYRNTNGLLMSSSRTTGSARVYVWPAGRYLTLCPGRSTRTRTRTHAAVI